MPLQHIQLRAKESTPALAKGLRTPTYGGTIKPYAGPTSTLSRKLGPSTKSYFRPGAGSLEEILRAAIPATGSALDVQEEAWTRRKEMVAAKEAEMQEAAKGLYDRLLPLDEEGRNIALNAAQRYKPEIVDAMEKEGYISPDGTLAEPEQAATSVEYVTADTGEMLALTTFPNGRIETEHTGVYPATEAEPTAVLTPEQEIALGKYGMEAEKFGTRFRDQAINIMGAMPRPGIDTLTVDGKEVLATAEHANAWLEGVNALTAYLSGEAGEAPPEVGVTLPEIKAMYEGRPDLISAVQQNLGIPVTGVWDEETERQFELYGPTLEGEPAAEGKPKFERQKKFWADWLKKWGKTFKGVTRATKEVF